MHTIKQLRFLFGTAIFLLGFQSCGNSIDYGEIPWEDIYVNFSVYPYSLDNRLAAVGNYKVFENEGVWGVFV